MRDTLGRAAFRAAAALLSCGLVTGVPAHSRAQSDDDAVTDSDSGSRRSSRRSRRRHRSSQASDTNGRSSDSESESGSESDTDSPDNDEAPRGARASGSASSAARLSTSEPVASEPASSGTGSSGGGSSDGEEIIADPELEDSAEGGPTGQDQGWSDGGPSLSASSSSDYDPMANTGIAHLELIGQFGADVRHEGDLEDAYESRLRFDAEVEFRRSRTLRLSVGLRTDLLWALPAASDPDLTARATETLPERKYSQFEADRFELDFLPLSAFVDMTPADGFHLRLGTQPVSMARMDFYSPIDILAAYDLRGQPKVSAGSGRLSQPAVRVDWDFGSWATLQVIYLPWFMPNLARPNRDRYVGGLLGTGTGGTRHQIDELVDPSFQTKASETGIRFLGPAPDFTTPQAQARLNMRGNGFELAVSGGTAIEKMPSIYITPLLEKAISTGGASELSEVAQAATQDGPLLDVAYHRYYMAGLDGSLDVGPFTFGFEATYSPSRHLAAATADASHLPQPNVSMVIVDPNIATGDPGNVLDKSIRKGVPIVQGALHLEYLRGESIVLGVEGFILKTFDLPYDKTRDWWGFNPGTGVFAGGLIGASYRPNPDDNRWRFDLSLVGLVGPSLIAMPQIEYRMLDNFYVNLAAQFFEGRNDGIKQGGAQNINAGALYSGYDQVLLGFRYTP